VGKVNEQADLKVGMMDGALAASTEIFAMNRFTFYAVLVPAE